MATAASMLASGNYPGTIRPRSPAALARMPVSCLPISPATRNNT
jgi:hypothetical protein